MASLGGGNDVTASKSPKPTLAASGRSAPAEPIPADPADSKGRHAAAQPPPGASRLEPPMMTPASAPAITMETKKGCAPPPGRRRSVGAGPQHQLRSPAVKRLPQAPVALQGWLYKQGSEGLMLWKRRWFVLSEYCLFYYKGPEEEKLLGSILLPSYRVGPCSPDDRVHRKHAFKAEHANMRTYFFAADSRELMVQWTGALGLASLLQQGGAGGGERPSQQQPPASEDSDSGFHGYQLQPRPRAPPPRAAPVYANAPPKPRRLEPDDCAAPAERRTPDTYARSSSATPGGGARDYEDVYAPGDPASVTHVYRRPSGQVAHIRGAGPPLSAPRQPRPHSADFLDHHGYHTTPLPHARREPSAQRAARLQRPKSSLDVAPAPAGDSYYWSEELYAQKMRQSATYLQHARPRGVPAPPPSSSSPSARSLVAGGDLGQVAADGEPLVFRHSRSAQVPSLVDGDPMVARHSRSAQVPSLVDGDPMVARHSRSAQVPSIIDGDPMVARHSRSAQVPSLVDGDPMVARHSRSAQVPSIIDGDPMVARHSRSAQVPSIIDGDPMVARHSRSAQVPSIIDGDPMVARHSRSAQVPSLVDGDPMVARHSRSAQVPTIIDGDPMVARHSRSAQVPSIIDGDPMVARHPRLAQVPTGGTLVDGDPLVVRHSRSVQVPTGGSLVAVGDLGQVAGDGEPLVFRHSRPAQVPSLVDGDPVVARRPKTPEEQQQQPGRSPSRRWSEYADPRADGQFLRSASARLPRQRFPGDEEGAAGVPQAPCEGNQKPRTSSDVREGDRKVQQREESMRRLLEWKQRMLQSPLTRKPSGSSARGELSRGHQRQALRELAGRSRSQDPARRSSTSVCRHNSYSSDDEEAGDVRKARKRVRRPSQAGRSRQGSVEGRPSRRHPLVPPHAGRSPAPSYENVAPGPRASRVETSEVRRLRPSGELPPDADYGDQRAQAMPKTKHVDKGPPSQGARPRKPATDATPARTGSSPHASPLRPNKYPEAYLRSGSSSRKSSGDASLPGAQDDRCSSGKHSDSGYDTLQAGRVLPGDKDPLAHLWPQAGHLRSDQFVYPAHWSTQRKSDKWNSKIEEGHLVKEYTYEYIVSGNEKPGNKKETCGSKNAMSPPTQNIYQNRIKTLEEEKEHEISKLLSPRETLEFQEPLKMSLPMYQPNEAHVSSLKSAEYSPKEAGCVQESSNSCRSEMHNFVFGQKPESLQDTVAYSMDGSTQGNVNTSRKPLSNSKSVKDLLADFERKSQLVKEAQENECSGEKRYVFSDTETLLYETSSDVEGGATTKGGSDDDKDDEVAAALGGRREKFQSACRDLGRGHSKTDSDDLEVIMTPGFLRLSMAESLVTHENSDSTCTTPTNKKENTSVVEEHYVPMTPSKKAVLAPPDVFGLTKSPSASQTIIMENIFGFGAEYEESSYVEMTEEGLVKSLLAPDNDASFISKLDLKRLNSTESTRSYPTPESPRYCEIDTLDREYSGSNSHYELLYRSTSHYEPVYMEVSPVADSLKVRDLEAKKVSKGEATKFSPTGKSLEKIKSNEGEDRVKNSPPPPPKLSLPDILHSSSNLMQTKHTDEMDRESSDADDEASKDLDSLDAPRHPRFSLSDTFRPASYYLGASRAVMVLGGISSMDHQDSSDSDLVSPPPIPTSPPPIDELDNSLEPQDLSFDDKKQLLQAASSGTPENFPSDAKKFHNGSLNGSQSSGSESMDIRHPDCEMSPDYLSKRRPVSGSLIGSLDEFHRFSCSDQRSGSDLESIGSRLGFAVDLDDQLSLDIDTYLEDLQTRDVYSVEPYPNDHNYSKSFVSEMLQRRDSPLNDSVRSMETKTSDFICDGRRQEVFSNAKTQGMDASFISAREPKVAPSPCRQVVDVPLDDDVHYENLHIIPPPPEHSNKFGGEQQRPVTGDELYPSPSSQSARPDEDQQDQQQAGAPYYYSDLLKVDDEGCASSASERSPGCPCPPSASEPLNNQRGRTAEGSKRNDIGRRVNPIQRSADDENRRLAEELRTTSAHFLGAADKSGRVDQRNIYRADTLKRRAARPEGQDECGLVDRGESLPRRKARTPVAQRRSRSLEGLLDDCGPAQEPQEDPREGGDHWEEDALWRESLRRVSLRHTRSLENLDGGRGRQKVTREVTYVNDGMARYREGRRRESGGEGALPARECFEMDRETLRQWDLMSSAPMLVGARGGGSQPSQSAGDTEDGRPRSSAASGSGSVIGRDPLPPRSVSAASLQQPPPGLPPPAPQQPPPEAGDPQDTPGRRAAPWDLSVSAGDLLGRTHEELVLLLIQLRRQSAGLCKAVEACRVEIEAQARLAELDAPRRLEHLQKLEELKKHLLDLEKQYEKGKPLVNLVDNMVKLGSLYRGGGVPPPGAESLAVRDRLEFNQKVQEQRLLAQERRDWERLSPDQGQLQAKVQELYRLDRVLQEESSTLQSLQQDKELLEKALGGLRSKLQGSRTSPAEAERYRRQQRLLEKELSRTHLLLAHNSKKLEETVAENARLEQELVMLRQKWQASRGRGPSPRRPLHPAGATTAALEAELRRVQRLVGDLQRQRQELSAQVRQLTDKSRSLVRQIGPGPPGVPGVVAPGRKRQHGSWLETDLDSLASVDRGLDGGGAPPSSSPRGPHALPPPSPGDGRPGSVSYDGYTNGEEADAVPPPLPAPPEMPPDYPPPPPPPSEEALMNGGQPYCTQMDINEADDRMKRFYGIIPREKQQEIKTVRIVKRESERRQRDRDRSGNIGIPLTNGSAVVGKRVSAAGDVGETATSPLAEKPQLGRVVEEEPCAPGTDAVPARRPEDEDPVLAQFQRSMSLPRGFGKRPPAVPPPPPARVPSPRGGVCVGGLAASRQRFESCSGTGSTATAREQLFGEDVRRPPSPVFKSEAARAIILEVSDRAGRRAVPREKRRHHTVSSAARLLLDGDPAYMGSARSCDDLDMERALRPRLNAPDVVRSTMSHRDFKYNENTIDSILGTPSKILIPERYIPEQAPELSAEEQLQRMKKAESIRKMLSETSAVASGDPKDGEEERSSTLRKKLAAEKKQREHLLQLNQILARQVMEKSKIVAVKALATLPLNTEPSFDEDDLSPIQPLPLFQQRENFYS